MIELHIGYVSSDIFGSHQPRFPYPERGMSPYVQLEWARNLIRDGGRPDKMVKLSTFSPYIIGSLNNGMMAFRAGIELETPPLDPAQLMVFQHYEGGIELNGIDPATGLIDITWIAGAAKQLQVEFRILKEKVFAGG